MRYSLASTWLRRPFTLLLLCTLIIIASSVSLFSLSTTVTPKRDWIPTENFGGGCKQDPPDGIAAVEELKPWDSSRYVLGEPSLRFRGNLRNDTNYITSWANAGFTNQFISLVNMIYLGAMTDRVPIIPPFAPDHHITREAGIITFGEIFNLTHLRAAMRMPILEWKDVKELPSSSAPHPYDAVEMEDIGCWSTRKEADLTAVPAETHIRHLGLDPSYTRTPAYTRMGFSSNEDHIVFSKLAAVVYPKRPYRREMENLPLMVQSKYHKHRLPPDSQLTCFDILYYGTSGAEVFEWRFSFSPVWNMVGKHLLFNQWLVERSNGYLQRAFGLGEHEEIPPFIAIHIRQGDFGLHCDLPGHCLNSVDFFAEAVKRQGERLLDTKGIVVRHWLVSSDATDSKFWDEVRTLGWSYFDHEEEQTLEKYGEWQTPLVDMVAHGLASGFVGTEDSTFSLVGGRRVEDWNDSSYELVTQS